MLCTFKLIIFIVLIKRNPSGSRSEFTLPIDVSVQTWTPKSHSAIFWFIFQLFIKLLTVTQKAAFSKGPHAPIQFNTILVI